LEGRHGLEEKGTKETQESAVEEREKPHYPQCLDRILTHRLEDSPASVLPSFKGGFNGGEEEETEEGIPEERQEPDG
jgi:hypothetical protein